MILLLFHPFFDIVWFEIWKLVFIGILYSALVLLLSEVVQFYRDKKEFGVLAGDYERENWFEKIEKNRRAEDLTQEEKQQIERSQKRVVPSTSYKEFLYGKGEGWNIKLKYLYKGVYTGEATYHMYWVSDKNQKTKVSLTLHLHADLNTGSGTYAYTEKNDSGTYSFQISETDANKLIVRYTNVIPSGIAEGYEIWKRIKPRR
jgi:hypothetical protein